MSSQRPLESTTPPLEQLNVKRAAAPFDDENNADLIIVSSDKVQFYVYKVVLSLASNFFRGMFSLPQSKDEIRNSCLPTVDFPENSATVDCILRLCYPVKDPVTAAFELAADILQAVIKYQMQEAIDIMKERFTAFIKASYPMSVYGLACRRSINSEPLARRAALRWINHCEPSWKGMQDTTDWNSTSIGRTYDAAYLAKDATAGQLYRLLNSIRTKKRPSKLLINGDAAGNGISVKTRPAVDISQFSDGDIIIRSSDGMDFRAHKVVIQLASKLLLPALEAEGCIQTGDVSIYSLSEHSSIIAKILEICNPSASFDNEPKIEDADLTLDILRVAMQYNIVKVESLVKSWWTKMARNDPFRVYFIAVRYGWKDLARQSARAAVFSYIEEAYALEMEYVSAQSYYNLMQYHHRCHGQLSVVMKTIEPGYVYGPFIKSSLLSTWKTDAEDRISEKVAWNDEIVAAVVYYANIFRKNENFDKEGYKSHIKSTVTKLTEAFNTISLEI